MTAQDKRALWNDSPELRESIKRELFEWGDAQKGGMPNLGHHSFDPIFASDTSRTIRFDHDKIQRMDDSISLWIMLNLRLACKRTAAIFERRKKAAKHYFIGGEPAEAISKKCKCGTATVYRDINEFMFAFWLMEIEE